LKKVFKKLPCYLKKDDDDLSKAEIILYGDFDDSMKTKFDEIFENIVLRMQSRIIDLA